MKVGLHTDFCPSTVAPRPCLKKETRHSSVLNYLSHHSQINGLLTRGEGINSRRRIFSLANVAEPSGRLPGRICHLRGMSGAPNCDSVLSLGERRRILPFCGSATFAREKIRRREFIPLPLVSSPLICEW